MTFTGYTFAEVTSSPDAGWQSLLKATDLLIAGRYVVELADYSRPWVGSSNKTYHFLTPKYRGLETELHRIPNRLEVRLAPDGRILVNGMAAFPEAIERIFGSKAEDRRAGTLQSEGT